ncbi:pentapeptide repeat-containing protein [Tolypothrix sp. NIES-4075]|uniref:pentapeptide repeat-containing protein n=1 Tax=Tolypothrix sp. NIES-4075 TaxID=2005459 RepID=UPI000B5CB626|nr:pentapeptide repeat-containing protein [Tolypothrix sp. NIES-4075]GAX40488.1 pentapeptide repeat-containing protein [Tolypothrix sp. NIES-4075]
MTDSSFAKKKKKVTYTASTQGIERAENALKRLGFESKSNFAESQLLSRSTVTKFFLRQPIQLDSFKRICEALKLNWAEVAGIIEEAQSERLEINSDSSPDTDEVVQVQAVNRQVTVIDKESKKIKAVIVLEGDINLVNSDLKVSLELALLTYPGDTIKITDIQAGSIRLIVEGSQEDIKRLVSRIQSGELKELRGFPVEDIQLLNESSDDEESDELNDKWHLVQEIVNHPVKGRKLRDADLSDADLSRADLIGANLSRADLIGADLSDVNLSRANLSHADLIGANLSRANLIGADLIDANLSDANLSFADLSFAYLSRADLSRADLSRADLSLADLSFADLSFANLSGANLSGANLIDTKLSDANLIDADLSGANLSGANLSGANVKNARFGNNQGISELIKRDLIQKGAIFEDSPGDRSEVLLPH